MSVSQRCQTKLSPLEETDLRALGTSLNTFFKISWESIISSNYKVRKKILNSWAVQVAGQICLFGVSLMTLDLHESIYTQSCGWEGLSKPKTKSRIHKEKA